ncbi:MAG: glycosyltransferase family 2 protein [bacterium]
MISYIIIGRNEGWKLDLCFKSIKKSIEENSYIASEVIYVDSASTDNSIEIARSHQFVKTYKLTADYNAPIARNVGARVSKGSILFFIDGDMEIEPNFLKNVINKNGDLCYGFIGGYYRGKYYNKEWNFLYEKQFPPAKKITIDHFEAFTGGLFLIKKELWDKVNGMKPYLTGGADPELAIRLAKIGVFKLWINKPMATHHTINRKRTGKIKHYLKRRNLTGYVLVYRENLTSKYALKRLYRSMYMSLYLVITSIATIFYANILPWAIFLYLLATIIKSWIKFRNVSQVFLLIFKDIIFILGFVFYWPNKKTEVEYVQI